MLKKRLEEKYRLQTLASGLPKPGGADSPQREGFAYPGSKRPVPLSNLYIPNEKANPVHPEAVDYYTTKGKEGKLTKMKSEGRPIVVVAEDSDFPEWVKLNKDPLNETYPKMFIMDGVHRTKAAEKLGKDAIEVQFDMLRNYI